MEEREWSPINFRSAISTKEKNLNAIWKALSDELEEPPSRAAVYSWAQEGSRGPKYESWSKAVARCLRVSHRSLFR